MQQGDGTLGLMNVPAEPPSVRAAMIQQPHRSALSVVLIHLVLAVFFLSPAWIRPDSVGVYSWLRSATFDGDLLFFNEWSRFGMMGEGFPFFKEVTERGTVANHWWIGTSILAAPFYVVSKFVAGASESLFPRDGFFGVYSAVLAWSTVLFGILSLIISLRLLETETDIVSRDRTLIHLAILFGTPLFWYEFRYPLGTHLAATVCIGVLIFLLARGEPQRRACLLAIGMTIGLAMATRMQHVVLIPAVVYLFWRRGLLGQSWTWVTAGMLPPLLAQAIAWRIVYGSALGPLVSGASLEGVTWMPFRHLAVLPVLFSSYHGLFSWCPITVLAIAGWLLRIRRGNAPLAATMLLMFLAEWLANGVFDRYFWGGLSFGPRRFTDLAVPFALGLGWFAGAVDRRIAYPTILLCTTWTVLLTTGAMAGTIDLARYLSFSKLVRLAMTVPDWSGLTRALSHAPAFDARLAASSVVAVLIIAGIALVTLGLPGFRARVAATLGYLILFCAALATTAPATAKRSAGASQAFRIDLRRAAGFGPLIDQRTLLLDELTYFRETGQAGKAATTAEEISRIDELLRAQ